MQASSTSFVNRLLVPFLVSAGAFFCGVGIISAQQLSHSPISAFAPPPVSNAKPNPGDVLVWDSLVKEQSPAPGQMTADYVFSVKNTADYPVAIGRLQPSCGCTTAKLPTTPWILAPQTNGDISVSVNLAGKFGAFTKSVTVFSTNNQIMKVLTVKVNMPENPEMARSRNMAMARGDGQAVFRGDCVKCHVDPARGKMGKELYVAACGICHEAKQRAQMVPDLHHLPHPTFYGYWRMVIADGKPHTLMPAFSQAHGGPLTDAQIDSLAKVLTMAFPSMPTPSPANAPAAQPMKTGSWQPATPGVVVR